MPDSQHKLPQRVWRCSTCGKVVEATRNAAGEIVCAQCGKRVTPELENLAAAAGGLPHPQPKAVAKPVAAQAMARRPQRPGTTSVRTPQKPAHPPRPGTPAEALASSGAWVPDPNPMSSPNLSEGGGGPPSPPAGTARSRMPIIVGGALIAVLAVVAVIIAMNRKSPTPTAGGAAKSPPAEVAVAPTDKTAAPSDATATAAGSTAVPEPAPVRRVIDLLSIVDLSRDVASGQWHQVPGGIASDDSKFARVSLPYEPPAEYDFHIEFTRASATNESLLQIFRVNGHECTWVMNGWKGVACAFNIVGAVSGLVDNPTAVRGIELRAGERHSAIVKVRKTFIEAYIDDKLITHYDTDGSDLKIGKDWNLGRKSLGLGSNTSSTVFHAIDVAEVTGRGKIITGPLVLPPPQPAKAK